MTHPTETDNDGNASATESSADGRSVALSKGNAEIEAKGETANLLVTGLLMLASTALGFLMGRSGPGDST